MHTVPAYRLNFFTLTALASAVLVGGTVSAAPADSIAQNYRIPAQRLENALTELAARAHLKLLYPADWPRQQQSQALVGRYTPQQALAHLLNGTGLSYQATGDNTITLVKTTTANSQNPTATVTLAPIAVVGEQETVTATDPYNPDYVLANATSATKTNTPVMETPLNIQVISKQVLKDQQIIRLQDALKNVSGVSTSFINAGSTGFSEIIVRGFSSPTTFRNGFRLDNSQLGTGNNQTANIESIEVLKGPAAILYGRVEPGGMVNTVTKQPLATPYYALTQQAGSYDLYRTSIDATGPLTNDDSVLYRANLSYENSGSFRDRVDNENVFFAPTLKWQISPQTQATLELEYNHANRSNDIQFLLTDANNQAIALPHSQNLNGPSPYTEDTVLVGLNWSHQFNDDWSIKHQVIHSTTDSDSTTTQVSSFDPASRLLSTANADTNSHVATTATILDVTGHFKTFGLEHTLLLGGDYYRYDVDFTSPPNTLLSSVNIDQRDSLALPLGKDPGGYTLAYEQYTDNYGLYLQDQIKLPYHFHVTGGFRYQNVHRVGTATIPDFDLVLPDDPQTDDAVTPRVGLLWQADKSLSLYSNYAENFGANNGRVQPGGKPLPPQSAQQWEVGAKSELFDGRLRATLAYYELTKQNIATNIPGTSFVRAVGEVKSSGPELDIQGEILPGWNLIGTYANQNVRVSKDDSIPIGNRLQFVPRNIGSLWSTYEFHQPLLNGFKLGGGVNLQDGQVDSSNTTHSAGYALVSLMAGYSVKIGKTTLSAQLNIDNLLDKNYVTNRKLYDGTHYGYAYFGTPRTFLGSLSIQH